jgi:hypothetical protein
MLLEKHRIDDSGQPESSRSEKFGERNRQCPDLAINRYGCTEQQVVETVFGPLPANYPSAIISTHFSLRYYKGIMHTCGENDGYFLI